MATMMLSRRLCPTTGRPCSICARQQFAGRPHSATAMRLYAEESNLPRIANTSFWASLIPKPLRRSQNADKKSRLHLYRPRDWNPATIFVILGIVVGSNAIQMITLRNEMLNFSRKTDAKLSLLREVIQKVKDGKEVDVARELGTGNPQQEEEWEEVIKELEETDTLWAGRQKRDAVRAEKAEQKRLEDEAKAREGPRQDREHVGQEKSGRRPRFLM